MDSEAQRRAERRRQNAEAWPVRSYQLGKEPDTDPLDRSTASERLAQMWPLARAAWSVAGKPVPAYQRQDAPGVITRSND